MRLIRILAINLAVFIAIGVALEGLASVALVGRRFAERRWPASSVNDDYLTLPMFRNDSTAREYWDEFRRSSLQQYTDYVGWRRRDFAGRYINVVGGYRVTPGTAPNGPIFGVFGGSTIWGTGVADADTIPAEIAHAVRDAYRVQNFGEAGFNVFQDYIEFYQSIRAAHAPTVAVFYDGINDTYASCVNPGRTGATLEYARMKEKIEYRKASELRLGDVAEVVSQALFPQASPSRYRCDDDRQAQEVASAMVKTWRSIQDLGERAGTRTYFFLQPVAFVGSSDVGYLRLNEAARSSYQRVYAHIAEEVRVQGLRRFQDLSSVLSDGGQHFIDFAHLRAEANHRIGAAIVRVVEADAH